jgi:hypothetical protein
MSSSIAAILSCVCAQFNGEAKIHFDETLEGEHIKAAIDFGFILMRYDVLVCVMVAKRNRVEEGMVDLLIGSEILAEKEKRDKFYGIVSDFTS